MVKIRRNATKQMERILRRVKHVEYFVDENRYKGGKFGSAFTEKELKWLMYDLKEGHAILKDNENGTYTVFYASPCRWEMN